MESKKIQLLNKLLANTYGLMLKTQFYHWNFKGINFMEMHKMLEGHYEDLFEAVDEIAEHHLVLGHDAPADFKTFAALNDLPDHLKPSEQESLVEDLLVSHKTVLKQAEELQKHCAEKGDEITADLCISRMRYHSKVMWMLDAQKKR